MQEEGLPLAGEEALADIRTTTAGGKTSDGSVMQDYTPSYKRLKQSLVGSASPVNLRLTEEMIDGMKFYKTSTNTGEVNVAADDYKKAQGVSRLRPFLIKGPVMISNIRTRLSARLKAFIH